MTSPIGPDRGDAAVRSPIRDDEIARLRAERDAAVAALDRDRRHTRRSAKVRRVSAAALVLLFAVLLPITVVSTWAHRTVLNTNAYVATVKPIASDPTVTAAVSRQLTQQLYDVLDPQAIIAQSLPEKAAFLAGPIANGAKDAVQDAVNKVLQSNEFQQMWVTANRFAHAQLVSVLRGDSTVLQVTKGVIVLNLVPLLNQALQNAQAFVSGVVGRTVTLPKISGNELPADACRRIAAAIDRPVPETCGQIALFRAKSLQTAQQAVRGFDRLVLALLIVTPLVFAGALWLSKRRRRTLLQLTVGGMLALVVVRRALMWEQNNLIATGRPENKAARTAIVHQVLNGFFDLTVWFLVAGLVIVVFALLTGPYRPAVAVRQRTVNGVRWTGGLVSAAFSTGGAEGTKELVWVRAHFDALRIGGAVVALLLLLVLDVSFWGFLVIAVLLALFELWLHRLRPRQSITLPSSPPASPP